MPPRMNRDQAFAPQDVQRLVERLASNAEAATPRRSAWQRLDQFASFDLMAQVIGQMLGLGTQEVHRRE